jgi:hypothetical protein
MAPRKGYARIAALMAEYPESCILRRFSQLSIQNLLYLQAELVGLEIDFYDCQAKNDKLGDDHRTKFSFDWDKLQSTKDGAEDTEQWQLALKLRDKVKEYRQSPEWLTYGNVNLTVGRNR